MLYMFSIGPLPSINVHFVSDVFRFSCADCCNSSVQPSSVFRVLMLNLDVEALVRVDDHVACPSPFACDVLLRPLYLRCSDGFKFEGIPLPKCKSDKSREVAFILLNELATGCASNLDLVRLSLVRSFSMVVATSLCSPICVPLSVRHAVTLRSFFDDANVFSNFGVR